MQEARTVVQRDISSYLLKQISETPKFQDTVKRLQDGEDIEVKLSLKKKYTELPLEIVGTGIKGEITKSFEGTMEDKELRERVEQRLKTKGFNKDKDGYSYDE